MAAAPVILCTDGSPASVAALRSCLDLLAPDAPLVVVTVADEPDPVAVTGTGMAGPTMSPEEYAQAVEITDEDARRVAEETVASLDLSSSHPVTVEVLSGHPGPAVCLYAEEVGAAGIVMGSRGRGGLKRAVLGSVSDHVVRNAPCPVVVANARALER